MIDIVGIEKHYNTHTGITKAISDISLTASDGEFIGIIGPSGCGKTTLLKIIGNLINPTRGEVLINGVSTKIAREEGQFSFVFQNPVLLPWRRIIDNVFLPLEILKRKTRDPHQLLNLVGLKGFEEKYPHELSGGMQQRVALARALTFDPKVLLLDEPFGALDEFTRNELNKLLLDICYRIRVNVFFVTHSINEAIFLSDKIIVLSGRPAKIEKVISVPFDRPRNIEIRETKEFQELATCLRQKLA